MTDLVGKTIGKYRIVARLGRGGMAEVFKGYQPGLDRYVAVKVMHSHLSDDDDFVGRFKREAAAVANLRHPNIVQAYDFDVEGDLYYMVMEFIEGPTLKAELKKRTIVGKPLQLNEVARVFGALAGAIDYAHSRGMVHRDLKPANVMFTKEGQVVLTDFGIARIVGATRFTMTGAISGTPAYMSPEQGQGERGDERSDIYSLGVILYEMVVGQVPYDADTPFAIILKHINEPLPMPRTVQTNVPEAVERVILKSLSKNPDDRYNTASEMAAALREATGVSPDETLATTPLITLATAPRVEEIPVTPGMPASSSPAGTAAGAGSTQQAAAATAAGQPLAGGAPPPAKKGFPVVPVVIIAGLLLLICVALGLVFGLGVIPIGDKEQDQQLALDQQHLHATETAVAATAAAQNEITPTPIPTFTDMPTYTPFPTYTALPEPTATERVVVVTATGLPATDTPTPEPATDTPTPEPDTPTPLPTNTPAPEPTKAPASTEEAEGDEGETGTGSGGGSSVKNLSGRLAIPVDDGLGHYDVRIYSMSDGKELGKVTRARQPNFRPDGILAVNGEGGSQENIWQYNDDGSGGIAISASPGDHHPFWKFDGSGIVYDNPEMICAKSSCPEWHVFVQQGTGVPETRDVADKLVIDGDIFRDQPMSPVWATDDTIIFRACDIWVGGSGSSCGMWKLPSWATRGGTGFTSPPVKISGDDDIPTDTKADKLVFMSTKGGSWDVYVTGINGGSATNLSNNSSSDDGLGTISPDGKSVAFVSTRDGGWGVWVVPITGGTPQRVDIDTLGWGTGTRDWTTERISWGP